MKAPGFKGLEGTTIYRDSCLLHEDYVWVSLGNHKYQESKAKLANQAQYPPWVTGVTHVV